MFKLVENLNADNKKISNLPDPTADQDAATKKFLEDEYIPLTGKYISLTEGRYGQNYIKANAMNNLLYGADKRYTLVKTGNTIIYTPAYLFDGSLTNTHGMDIADGETVTLNIDLLGKGEYIGSGITYPYGTIYIHFYHTFNTTNVRTRLKTGNGGAQVWRDWRTGVDISNNPNYHVMAVAQSGEYYCTEVEIEITAEGGQEVRVAEIEWNLERGVESRSLPLFQKYANNDVWGDISLKDNSNIEQVALKRLEATIKLKETTTPSATANYGRIYTKNDNKLYFQDGAGAEHEISLVP